VCPSAGARTSRIPRTSFAANTAATTVVDAFDPAVLEVTVVVPGQAAENKPVMTGSITDPSSTTPVSMLDGKNGDEDF
jgi:hypothetical protein